MNETQEKLAAALLSSNASMLDKIDIGEDSYENVDLIIEFYSKSCKWEYDEVCVNDQSEWCADFIDNIKCGGCQEYEVNYPRLKSEASKA